MLKGNINLVEERNTKRAMVRTFMLIILALVALLVVVGVVVFSCVHGATI